MPQFSVTSTADDLTLLSDEELRVAAGLARDDDSQDETLGEYGDEVAAEIACDCAIASDGVNPPTLRSEECLDVFRLKCSEKALYLSRRHVSEVDSVTEDGIELDEADWRIEADLGKLVRLSTNADTIWTGSKIDVAYTAGFDTVPAELKAEAKSRVKIKVSEGSRDPLARSISTDIPGLETRTVGYQVGGLARLTDDGLSSESKLRLRRFMMQSMVG